MLEKVMIRNVIKCILMKVIIMILWGMSVVCIYLNTALWVPAIILMISILILGYSVYEDIVIMRIDMESYEENKR